MTSSLILPIDAVGMEILTRRERQVAELILDGCTDRVMAHRLGITKSTVNTYTKSLFKKLGIHKRSAIARAALEILNPPGEEGKVA